MLKIETNDAFVFVNKEDIVSLVVKYDGSVAHLTISKHHYSQTYTIKGRDQIEAIYRELEGKDLEWEQKYMDCIVRIQERI